MAARRDGIARGTVVLLGGRSEILAGPIASIEAAGASEVHTVEFDADATDDHQAVLERIAGDHGTIGVVVVAFGVLGDQARAERDPARAIGIAHTDYVAQVSVLTIVANMLRTQGGGQIVVFSSIAGVRVRRANYVYGSAKAGLDGFACGLADALHGSGVHLLLVRAGFVIGRMTEGMTPVPLLSSTPGQVADAVVAGLHARAGRVWVPVRLQLAAGVMRLVPRGLWRRMPR